MNEKHAIILICVSVNFNLCLKIGQLYCPFLCPSLSKTGPFNDLSVQKPFEIVLITFFLEKIISGLSEDSIIVRTTKCP